LFETTTDVLVESALWEPLNIAQTGRKLGINSDARYRFERGVDPAFTVPGLDLATRMILDLCGGTPTETIVVGDPHAPDRVIDFPLAEPKRLAGIDVPLPEIRRVLDQLGFRVEGPTKSSRLRCRPGAPTCTARPTSWRRSCASSGSTACRPCRSMAAVNRASRSSHRRKSARARPSARWRARPRGGSDVVVIAKAQSELVGGGKPELALANPIAADLSTCGQA